eukprot:CAMPEP_0119347428 /NCGR_PEP_ID=MMETSP1333-20130426/108518_1 /TAXON_ID=418940 /ORGANISM="Scyphosphaera apsteinii, Strain RCC1455" /LENGTH=443 /DNA_ID=CAMNT_0007359973 /DNA_START=26 /DNA_END=1357 /DNA_ORIENTATION=-
MSPFGPVDTSMTCYTSFFAFIVAIVGLEWGSWSQTDTLIHKVGYPGFYDTCPGCKMINKLTMRRSPRSWCVSVRQQVYLPPAPPSPPPYWRRALSSKRSSFNDTKESIGGLRFAYETWENTTCVPAKWYDDACSNFSTMLYPEGCEREEDNLTWWENEIVPKQCTADIYRLRPGLGDCTPLVQTNTTKTYCRIDAKPHTPCVASGQFSPYPDNCDKYRPGCTCTCGDRCHTELNKCSDLWTSWSRYRIAECQKGRTICKGIGVVYGLDISGIFFMTFAWIAFLAAAFIKNEHNAKFVNGVGVFLQLLGILLLIGAVTEYSNFNDKMNLPRKLFIEQMAETPILPLSQWPDNQLPMLNGHTPYYWIEYNRPNPWIWHIEAPHYVEANKVLQWNWSYHLLSRGWWATVSAIVFGFLAFCFGIVSSVSFLNGNRAYQPTPKTATDV